MLTRFPTPLSVIRQVILYTNMSYRGNFSDFSKYPIAPETESPAFMRTRLAQSSNLEIKANTGYSASLSFLGCPTRLTSSWVNERSSQYLIYLVILSNSQPYNQFVHIGKKATKNYKISKQNKNIAIMFILRA